MKPAALIFLLLPAPVFALTPQEAAQSAYELPRPDYGQMIRQGASGAYLESVSGSTSFLEGLRDGMGNGPLAAEGTQKSIACDTRGDPECLAIQLLKRGAAAAPELGAEETHALKEDLDSARESAKETLKEIPWEVPSTRTVCSETQTRIPARKREEVCDTARSIETTKTCGEGFTSQKETLYLYECLTGSARKENVCEILSRLVPVKETLWRCGSGSPFKERTCPLEAEIRTDTAYEYACEEKKAFRTVTACVKTLSVTLGPACSADTTETLSLSAFAPYGYNASARFRTARVAVPCADGISEAAVSFGTRSMGSVKDGETVSVFYRIPFEISYAVREREGTLTIKNTDTGSGSESVSVSFPVYPKTPEEKESFARECSQKIYGGAP